MIRMVLFIAAHPFFKILNQPGSRSLPAKSIKITNYPSTISRYILSPSISTALLRL
jgi:hypothetical protein